MNRVYVKINPPIVELRRFWPSHAIYETLSGENLIERFNVYRCMEQNEPLSSHQQFHPTNNGLRKYEVLLVDIKVGTKLNGNHGIIHGGIISLLFDEAMGWARGIMTHPNDPTVIYVTANLTVNFRAPFMEGSEAVIRVYHENTVNGKVRFSAVLEAHDGGLVYAEAGGLFLPTKSKL